MTTTMKRGFWIVVSTGIAISFILTPVLMLLHSANYDLAYLAYRLFVRPIHWQWGLDTVWSWSYGLPSFIFGFLLFAVSLRRWRIFRREGTEDRDDHH